MEEYENDEVIETPETEEVVGEQDDFAYTPEELEMIRQANGVSSEDVVEEESVEDENPWAWAGDTDPKKIQKSWEKFTQSQQEVSAMKKELEEKYAPAQQFMDELSRDPQLVALIQAYYSQEKTPFDEVANLKAELNSLKNDITIKEEMGQMRGWVAEQKLPDFDERELMEYAAKNNSPSLQSAYKDMMFDEIRNVERENTLDEIKKTKGAAVPKINNGSKKPTGVLTQAIIDKMSDEEFQNRYGEIQEFYANQK